MPVRHCWVCPIEKPSFFRYVSRTCHPNKHLPAWTCPLAPCNTCPLAAVQHTLAQEHTHKHTALTPIQSYASYAWMLRCQRFHSTHHDTQEAPLPSGCDEFRHVIKQPPLLQAVDALPEHIALLTLRAALAAVPPSFTKWALAVSAVPHAERRGRRLLAVLCALPERLQPLVLRAHDPAVDAARSLTLVHADSDTAAAVMRAAAFGLSTHLTALTLRASLAPSHPPTHAEARARSKADGSVASLDAVSAPLAHLAKLESLEFCVVNRCAALQYMPTVAGMIPRLTRLTHLDISGAGAGAAGLRVLARSLPALRALQVLDVSHGGIEANDRDMPQLRAFAGGLRSLRSLTRLSLSHNSLRQGRWEMLAPAVSSLPLRALNLQMCGLRDDFDLFAGCEYDLHAFECLEEINLSKNDLCKNSAAFLNSVPRLRRLTMTRLAITPEAEERLVEMLDKHPSSEMEVFKIGQCFGEPDAAAVLCRCIERWEGLRAFGISWRRGVARALLPGIVQHLTALPLLRELHIGYACLSTCDAVPEALGELTGLTSLRMLWMQCSAGAGAALSACVGALTALRTLSLWCATTECEPGCGEALVGGLAPLSQLTFLSLDTLNLKDDGAVVLAGVLTCMGGLHELQIPRNGIGPAGMKALANALPALRVLSVLELSRNHVGDAGAEALGVALRQMGALRMLGLGVCDVGPAGQSAVMRSLPNGLQNVVI